MKQIVALLTLFFCASFIYAVEQKKSCEELKAEIAAKLDAKGVKNYTLEIVLAADVKDATVVGSCDGGTKKITYKKN